MTIHREGFKSISIAAFVFILINLVSFNWLSASLPWLTGILFAVTLFLFVFIISFFRVPRRNWRIDPHCITSPCDGKVVVIEEVTDPEYFNDKRIQVSVFMSPANVHLNINPITGNVLYSKYHKGKYLVAWHPKSSTENERHSVVLQNERVTILVKQIAGALAKRIVNYLQPGEQVEQGGELGFIKFGSRVDLLLPPGTKVEVSLHQKVQAGVTVIATY
ncbi:MAG TPA: phosphatidylserine decarboxylase family protein [Lacibacter sp.]|nr:phosphatidylserine decarboxylase family protein [Lacibacter sp.]HMO88602.1 phosphatidylserine decarboxylase family protein [Lacibacter sp.]HMP85968.1 phosphatidylserine decarboxylase family protein [Lacibacter sp.]